MLDVFAAEVSLLGSMLIDPAAAHVALEKVTPQSFSDPRHSQIFKATKKILDEGRALDLVLLQSEIATEVPHNKAFVDACMRTAEQAVLETPTSAHLPEYVAIVANADRRFRLEKATSAVLDKLRRGVELNGEAEELRGLLVDGPIHATVEAQPPEPAPAIFARTEGGIPWILEPLLAAGSILQIQGQPKGGKSCFALLLALSCALGRWMSGRFSFQGGARRTLFITYEDAPRRLKHRARSYLPGLAAAAVPASLLMFERPPVLDLSTPEGQHRLETIVRESKVEVLFVDTLSWVSRGDENLKADMMPVLSFLRRLCAEYRLAVIVIHHTRKGGTGGDLGSVSERGRGSSAIAAAADAILDWGARAVPNVTSCALISKDVDGDEFNVRYSPQDDGSVRWGVEDVVEREDTARVQGRIMEAIRSLSVTAGDKVTATLIQGALADVTKSSVHDHLKALVGRRRVERLKEAGPKGVRYFKLSTVGMQTPDAADGGVA